MKTLILEVTDCSQCPYRESIIKKGMPNGEYACRSVWEKSTEYMGHPKVPKKLPQKDIGRPHKAIPDWCPLPDTK